MPIINLSVLIGAAMSLLFVCTATAQDEAAKPVILTLINLGTEQTIELTEDELLALDQVTIHTENEFVDGIGEFSGPLARDVLALFNSSTGELDADGNLNLDTMNGEVMDVVGDAGRIFTLTAVNDYAVSIPSEDFLNYDVIFAMFQDGERLSLRTKGPLWVIYPMSDHKKLQDRTFNDRLIWQLTLVSIE